MEDTNKFSASKLSKFSPNSARKCQIRSGQPLPCRLQTEQRGQKKEQTLTRRQHLVFAEVKQQVPTAQGLLLTTERPQSLPKLLIKEQSKPLNFRLHTEQRAARRAGYNDLVTSKINSMEILKRFEEKILKVIEEEEIKIMRKEMVPKAQLMPIFDRPFIPQRSTRPLTVPKEPSFLKLKCCIGGEFHRHFCHNANAIK
ncbi:microtubule-destabilizing protein 60 [Typha latifolia]|uniref:microtubule-destabilizing protein 60 n=1 Tax=Typha latifolia TaxID=4733 RepID=UPI003C2D9E25